MDHLPTPPPKKKRIIYHHKITYHQNLVVSCMVVVGSNFFEHRIHPWFRITKTSCHFGLHIALNAIGLLPCKMILAAKCHHFMCTPWCAMLVSFPLVSFVEKLGNNKKNSSGDNNRLKTQELAVAIFDATDLTNLGVNFATIFS